MAMTNFSCEDEERCPNEFCKEPFGECLKLDDCAYCFGSIENGDCETCVNTEQN